MLYCSNCHNEQEIGKFCGKCGTELEKKGEDQAPIVDEQVEEVKEQAASQEQENPHVEDPVVESSRPEPVPTVSNRGEQETSIPHEQENQSFEENAQSNVNMDQIKTGAMKYWDIVKLTIQNPAKSFNLKESQFSFGLTTIILFVLTQTLTIYFYMNSQYKAHLGFASEFGAPSNIPFFEVMIRAFLVYFVLFAAAALAVFALEKIFIKRMSFKLFVSQFGVLYTPLLALNIITIILALANSTKWTVVVFLVSLFYAFIITPAIFMYEKLNHYKTSKHTLYISYATIIVVIFALYIVSKVFLDSFLGDFGDLDDLIDF